MVILRFWEASQVAAWRWMLRAAAPAIDDHLVYCEFHPNESGDIVFVLSPTTNLPDPRQDSWPYALLANRHPCR